MNLKVFTDGGSRGNPGIAGIGVYITDENNNPLEQRYKYLGIKTNNEAEYWGAFYGIKRAIELGAIEISLFMDSKLVISQLNGEWKIKDQNLKSIYIEIQNLLQNFSGKINFFWIRREENKEADRLSNKAMDSQK